MAKHIFNKFIGFNVAPESAKKIGVYNKSGTRLGSVSIDNTPLKKTRGTKLYSFGILSDVHQKVPDNGTSTQGPYQSYDDLKNALEYLTGKSVDFTCICGDLIYTYESSANDEYDKYKEVLDSVTGHAPVLPVTGNHDCPRSGGEVDFVRFKTKTGLSELTDGDGYKYEFSSGNSYVMHKLTASGGKNFIDHFFFLGLKSWSLGKDNKPYADSDIDWLGEQLEKYDGDRCFIITHLFFPYASGTDASTNPKVYGAGNVRGAYPEYNWLLNPQLGQLEALRDAYPNSIWFSGHSHFKWDYQFEYKNENVCPSDNTDRTSALTVHVPSCAYPCGVNSSNNRIEYPEQSEGGIIDVYEDGIEIKGIEFKGSGETNWDTPVLVPVAQYFLPISTSEGSLPATEPVDDGWTHITDKMVIVNDAHPGALFEVDNDTHEFTAKFSAKGQKLFLSGTGGTSNGGKLINGEHTGLTDAQVIVRHSGIQVSEDEGNTWTDVMNLVKMGILQKVEGSASTYNTINGVKVGFLNDGGVTFSISSSAPIDSAWIKVKDLRWKIYDENDEDNDDPNAGNTQGSIGNSPCADSEGFYPVTGSLVFRRTKDDKRGNTNTEPEYSVDEDTHNLTVTFTAANQGIAFRTGLINGNIITKKVIVKHDGVIIDGTLPETASQYVGVYSGLTFGGTGYKGLLSEPYEIDVYDVSLAKTSPTDGGVQINTSSKFVTTGGGIVPVTITFKNLRYKNLI